MINGRFFPLSERAGIVIPVILGLLAAVLVGVLAPRMGFSLYQTAVLSTALFCVIGFNRNLKNHYRRKFFHTLLVWETLAMLNLAHRDSIRQATGKSDSLSM